LIQEIRRNTVGFPDPSEANKDGIVAWGGDLHPYRVLDAYRSGIFPWYSKNDPILWWSPDPRLVMDLDDIKISRSLKKNLKKFEYKFDTHFSEVIKRCATTPRATQDGTWIQPEVIESFTYLHKMGYAHSVESYYNGELVGGLYGIAIGRVFCGESMFSIMNDASKSAYVILVKHLKKWGFDFVDCQVPTEHLKSLGAKEISREEFLMKLKESSKEIKLKEWKIDEDLTALNIINN